MSRGRTTERRLDEDRETPAIEITETVADLKGIGEGELTPIYTVGRKRSRIATVDGPRSLPR